MPIDLRALITPDVLDLVQDSVFLRDTAGRVLYWNKAAAKLYGWTAEEACGKNAHELLKTRQQESLPTLETRLRTEDRWRGKLMRTSAAGVDLVVDARWLLQRDARGEPIAIVETNRDVTARVRAALTPDDRERRYRNLFENPAAAFFESDFTDVGALIRDLRKAGVDDLSAHLKEHPEVVREMMRLTHVIDVNDYAVERFSPGCKQDVTGPQDVFWPDASTPVFAESVIAAVTGQPNFVRETTLRTAQGVEFDAEFAVHFDPENTSNGLVTVAVVDITERNRARAAFEHAQFMYRNLFHGMAVPFVRIDSSRLTAKFRHLRTEGVTDLSKYIDAHPAFVREAMEASIVVEANERAVQFFGATDQAQLFGPLTRCWPPEQEHVFGACIAAGFRGASGHQYETRLRRLDGSLVDAMLLVFATPEMRERGIVLAGYIDISEQVSSRAAIERMQADLAHSARVSMLGELTASIAHEINQPLTAITTNAEAGLRWLGRTDPDIAEVRAVMERVIADARRAADVIKRVRGMAVRRDADLALISINSVVEEAAMFLQHEMQAQGISLVLEFTKSLPGIRADRIQIQQVVVNLMVNAIHAMTDVAPDRRRLRVSTGMVDGSQVMVQVEDSGPGIPIEVQSHLFERFYSTKPGGMGMGLPICQSIVETHGGHINVDNHAGVGARFSFTLPLDSE